MNPRLKKSALFILRWGIAIAGIWWVVANMSLRDHVLVLDTHQIPHTATLSRPGGEGDPVYHILDPQTGRVRMVDADQVINAPDRPQVTARLEGKEMKVKLLGLDLTGDVSRNPRVARLLIQKPGTHQGVWISPAQAPGYQLHVPHARVHIGLITMVRQANPLLLWLALLVFPMTYIITSYRWGKLMDVLEIHLPLSRTFVLNMVGAFYNTFMPGSTGGDLLKAYYASKQTPHRVHAVMSVLVDRVIGLIALILLGGVMAGAMVIGIYMRHGPSNDPVARICLRVAVVAALGLGGMVVGLVVYYHPALRRRLGIDFLLSRLPM